MRDSVPYDRIAATCSPMTNAAPITAATICATSRVRFGPMHAEQRDRERDRERGRRRAHRDHDAIGAEPARAAARTPAR